MPIDCATLLIYGKQNSLSVARLREIINQSPAFQIFNEYSSRVKTDTLYNDWHGDSFPAIGKSLNIASTISISLLMH